MKKSLLALLALLCVVVQGSWAQEPTPSTALEPYITTWATEWYISLSIDQRDGRPRCAFVVIVLLGTYHAAEGCCHRVGTLV